MSVQKKLFDQPISKKDAKKIAYEEIRSRLGTVPSPGKPEKKDDVWKVPIVAKYPRVLSDESGKKPSKIRYMDFGEIEKIMVDSKNGEVLEKPTYYDVQSEIQEKLSEVRERVEEALVKAGSSRFAKLPFPEHMHTPIIDILSWVLTNDKIEIDIHIDILAEKDKEKYLKNIQNLKQLGLVKKEGNIILPDNNLIEIERKYDNLPNKVSNALAFYFERGHEFIESIREVLGPHLTISSYCYKEALEYGEIKSVTYDSIENIISRNYPGQLKKIKLPRYLMQLESVNLLDQVERSGEKVWIGKEDVFKQIQGEEEILSSVMGYFHEKSNIKKRQL